MPGWDETGPLGYSPVTGRGLGPCGRKMRRGFTRRGWGRAWGAGWGRGFIWGPGFDLKGYKKYLEEELKLVNEELMREEKE
ncbi:hypothetical protein SAMN02745221_00107 [Thermosyntropha lipolytica DSM 11003]|uniref:Cytoplasmic protein n=1 Tax=Thermosyntropha lipolytica DSM 11003 TaxID=1123382 RepID=A0A1M5JG30_9FIRM|nr:DUF5320 domain-containing protein [Thermosyntropha lipolytica]SHG39507.1 hypothetical protein SAMN02745221_00107 [Thermosyntropha lipolytica DSM 11003]